MADQGQVVGYLRVSSETQNVARQLDGIVLDEVFEDRASGRDTKRPQLEAMLRYVRRGDTVICHSMDRLARNLDDLRKLVTDLTRRGVQVRFVKENLTFTGGDSPMANLLLSLLGAVSQFERELIKERQREGIAVAKRKGVYKGRKRCLSEEQAADLRKRIQNGERKTVVARQLGISRETVYTYLRTTNAKEAA